MEDLGGIIGTREQVLAAILLQRWRRRQARGGGKVAPTPAKGAGGARWQSALEVQDLHEVIGTREQVLACIRIQQWRRLGHPTPAQIWDAASDDHEVHGLAAEARQATMEGAANEQKPRAVALLWSHASWRRMERVRTTAPDCMKHSTNSTPERESLF